jgi:hypothetical protein
MSPLDEFGRFLMVAIRDRTIGDCQRFVAGELGDPRASDLQAELASLPTEARRVLSDLVGFVVDRAIHDLLDGVDKTKGIDIVLLTEDGTQISVKETSDGLAGELYGKRGWLATSARFPSLVNRWPWPGQLGHAPRRELDHP